MSFGFSGAAALAFLAARAVLQPDRWWDPGIGWLAVVAVTVATVATVTAYGWRAIQRVQRDRYLRANRR